MALWGIDLGGTKIEGAILPGPDSRDPVVRLRIPTEADRGYLHIVARIAELVRQMEEASGLSRPAAIGIGTPGAREPETGLMKNCNTTCLNGMPLHADLEQALGCSVRMANDANCFALAEARLGVARGAGVVFGVILGTGVGGGVVVHGRVLEGRHGIAGEWGHNSVDPDRGELCYSGIVGCVESKISGPALERFYVSRGGMALRLPEIVARHRAGGDDAATATVDSMCKWFGRALSQVLNVLDPDVVVLGGGVGQVDELYTRGRSEVAKWLFNPVMRTEFLRPQLGDSAGVFGAALLVS